ncbi:MAG: hypothetical protein Sylvanvirus10_30 [Sylvanvirus sp.]|uniref:Uncharacterized protein n=1 Tax=Sylvanvirus sp. TaxID=2487774 RepID=A0A3G5AKK3_9VIRU|nr:MAG: hypothetical protein Sylvanvirus10_30 [Sylvanvirus sp.]
MSELTTSSSVVYIGSFTDVCYPFKILPNLRNLVCIDCEPGTQHYSEEFDPDQRAFKWLEEMNRNIGSSNELPNMKLITEKPLKRLLYNQPAVLQWQSRTHSLTYFCNQFFPQCVENNEGTTSSMSCMIRSKLSSCDGIVVKGFYPHASILNMVMPNATVYLDGDDTYLPHNEDELKREDERLRVSKTEKQKTSENIMYEILKNPKKTRAVVVKLQFQFCSFEIKETHI